MYNKTHLKYLSVTLCMIEIPFLYSLHVRRVLGRANAATGKRNNYLNYLSR